MTATLACAAAPVVRHTSTSSAPPVALPRSGIVVTMTGLRNEQGAVLMGLYDTPSRWPQTTGALMSCHAAIHGDEAVCVFEPLRAGADYAVAGQHDENGNGRFDQNILGVPLEGFAFTNDARPLLAAPSWDECKVRFEGGALQLRIRVQY